MIIMRVLFMERAKGNKGARLMDIRILLVDDLKYESTVDLYIDKLEILFMEICYGK